MNIHDVVQLNEKHRWTGCIGIVNEIGPIRVIVGIPIPEKGTAYVFAAPDELEVIGKAVLVPKEGNHD